MPIVGKILSAAEFKAQFKVITKGARESAYVGLKEELGKLAVGEVYTCGAKDIVDGLGKALPKHFKANMRKRLKDWTEGTSVRYEMVEAAAEGSSGTTYAFIRLA